MKALRYGRGTTLIELLISLAIIVLMTGITFPIFSYYQKRSNLDSEIRNFVQLFNYARALQNNPDNFSRTDANSSDYRYVIKFTNIGDIRRAELYSKNDPEKIIIDKVDFSGKLSVQYQNQNLLSDNGNGLTLEFSGLPPTETITCSKDCSEFIKIRLTTTGLTKAAKISNTTTNQLMSVDIIN